MEEQGKAQWARILATSLIALSLCALLLRFFGSGAQAAHGKVDETKPGATYSRVFSVFNTECRVTLYDCPQLAGDEFFRELISEMGRLHSTLNVFSADSEVSKVNASASSEDVVCSPLLWDVLMASKSAWQESEGLFDVTVGPLLKLWGFHAKRSTWPTEQEIAAAKAQIGFDKLKLDESCRSVRFGVDGMRLDFGGIAKGYALGVAIDIAKRHGIKSYLIDLGGNIYCTERAGGRKGFRIGVRSPDGGLCGTIAVADRCIASSGNYERFRVIGGRKVGHLMNPLTGLPCSAESDWAGVTVVVGDPTLSDVYSTTVFVGGLETARKLNASGSGRPAFVMVRNNGKIEIVGDVAFSDAVD